MPWAPIGPDTSTRSPGRTRSAPSSARTDRSQPGGADIHAVGPAVLDHLGVAGHDRHARAARGGGQGFQLGAEHAGGQAGFENQRHGDRHRPGAGHGQIVDRAVDGQFADRAAGKPQRLNDEAVCRHGDAAGGQLQRGGIRQGVEPGIGQNRPDQSFDQLARRFTAGAVRHRDLFVGKGHPVWLGFDGHYSHGADSRNVWPGTTARERLRPRRREACGRRI